MFLAAFFLMGTTNIAAAYCYEEIPLRFLASIFDTQIRYLVYRIPILTELLQQVLFDVRRHVFKANSTLAVSQIFIGLQFLSILHEEYYSYIKFKLISKCIMYYIGTIIDSKRLERQNRFHRTGMT